MEVRSGPNGDFSSSFHRSPILGRISVTSEVNREERFPCDKTIGYILLHKID